MHPDDAAGARDAWQRAIRDGTPYEVEYRVRTVGGDYRWMVARALPVRGIDGQVIQWAGTWTDVDDLNRLHDLLGGPGGAAASLAILQALQSTAPVGIGFVDRELHIVHMNELLAGLNGLSSDEAQGRSLPEVMGSIWPRFEPLYRQVIETGKAIANVGTARTNAEGVPSHWLNSYFPVRVDTEVVGVGVVGIDVTDRKRELITRLVSVVDLATSGSVVGGSRRRRPAPFDVSQGAPSGGPPETSGPVYDLLSDQQRAILRLISEGYSNREIASRVHLSENTVKTHIQEIFRKLGVRTRVEAAIRATREGLF